VAFLAESFQKALAADSWKTFNRNAKAIDAFLGPAEFRRFLTAEEARFSAIIDQLGLRKK
jgi:tripartite-type tricarboxylate transporter receptor subunit TctC